MIAGEFPPQQSHLGGDNITNGFFIDISKLLANFAAGNNSTGILHQIGKYLKFFDG